MKKNKFQKKKNFTGIAKVVELSGTPARFVKYRFNSPEKFTTWLCSRFFSVYYINFYSNSGATKRLQVGNYTKQRGITLQR